MAHILCITSGLTGILNASFEMVSQLQAAGHRVTCASPRAVQDKVKVQGFSYIQLPPMLTELAPPLPQYKGRFRKLKRMQAKILNASIRQEAAVDALGMHPFKKILEKEAPDFLIIDIELHEYIMTAYSLQQPMVLLSQWFSLWKRPGLPPLLHDTLPGNGWRGSRWGMEWAWTTIKIKRWWTFQKKKLRTVRTNRRSVLQAYAKQVDFPLEYIRENYWPGPFTYSNLPVISITAQELEFPHDPRPHLHYVGPMVFAERKEVKNNRKLVQEIEQILETGLQEGKSILYCSVSTFKQGDHSFLKKIIQAVANVANWTLIIGLGGLLDQKDFGQLPANVHAFSYVPQLQVLAKAHLSINHGGIHTINECLHYKVPMLVYSGKRSDQNGCAARIAYHGLGIMADKDKDDVATIKNKIETVLTDEHYRKNMVQMHQQVQGYQTKKRLTTLIAHLMSAPSKIN